MHSEDLHLAARLAKNMLFVRPAHRLFVIREVLRRWIIRPEVTSRDCFTRLQLAIAPQSMSSVRSFTPIFGGQLRR